MRPFGFKWAKAECEWFREGRTDYNLGWLSGYAKRRASFLRDPEIHVGGTHFYLGETWIYEGEIARYARSTGGESANQEKGHYRRWGVIGCIGCAWDISDEDEYAANQPPPKNERYCWGRGAEWGYYRMRCFRVPELHRVWNTGTRTEGRPALFEAKGSVGRGKVASNMDALKFEKLVSRIIATYDTNGEKLSIHFDNATCHSRRSDHWASPPRRYKKGGRRSDGGPQG